MITIKRDGNAYKVKIADAGMGTKTWGVRTPLDAANAVLHYYGQPTTDEQGTQEDRGAYSRYIGLVNAVKMYLPAEIWDGDADSMPSDHTHPHDPEAWAMLQAIKRAGTHLTDLAAGMDEVIDDLLYIDCAEGNVDLQKYGNAIVAMSQLGLDPHDYMSRINYTKTDR